MRQIKNFSANGCDYSKKQQVMKGWQWVCSYPDGAQTWAYVPGQVNSRSQVIDCIDMVNQAAEAKKEYEESLRCDGLPRCFGV